MKKLSLLLVLLGVQSLAWGAGGGFPLDHAPVNLENKPSLQRGARMFVNYCMGCHSAEHQRYNRFAQDVGLSEDIVEEHLVLTPDTKVGDLMKNSMTKENGKAWFGAAPPDLTLIARAKGADYLYTFLRTYYLDDSRATGVNNAAFPLTAMPHVLWELQGFQEAQHGESHGEEDPPVTGFDLVVPGALTPAEFDEAVGDLVNFLVYIAEPIRLERERLGFWVLLYIAFACVVFYLLKKEYWRDIH